MGRNVWMCFVSTVSTYIVLMVWLKSPQSQHSKTFCRLNIKKVRGRNVWMCFVSTALTSMALNSLEILMPSVDSVDIYICLTSLTHAKWGTCSTLCWKVGNISGSTELFAL